MILQDRSAFIRGCCCFRRGQCLFFQEVVIFREGFFSKKCVCSTKRVVFSP